MAEVKVIKINENINAQNSLVAEDIRQEMKRNKILFLNFMSGPGSGKTTTLTGLINAMKKEYRIGEMDVDIESSVDAQRVADATGIQSMQIHNGGLCHIDADMTRRALNEYSLEGLDLLILENIGNLVCPAEFDTGAHKNIALLSVPEGDDKPLKYPLMFTVSDVVVINKMDTMPFFEFSLEKVSERIHRLNPKALIFPISAKTGEGMESLINYIKEEIRKIKG
ncbi:MAG TPA: hydrogenase nickel incorporation protein HypB [Lachnospiraceae bacterium]